MEFNKKINDSFSMTIEDHGSEDEDIPPEHVQELMDELMKIIMMLSELLGDMDEGSEAGTGSGLGSGPTTKES